MTNQHLSRPALVLHGVRYGAWLVKEIFVAGWGIVKASFARSNQFNPVILRYPLRVTGAWEIFWFTSSITATPGTMSIGLREPVREGRPRVLLIHAVLGDDPADLCAAIADMEEHLAPWVKGIDHGVPGQGSATQLPEAFYEYPFESIGPSMAHPLLKADEKLEEQR